MADLITRTENWFIIVWLLLISAETTPLDKTYIYTVALAACILTMYFSLSLIAGRPIQRAIRESVGGAD